MPVLRGLLQRHPLAALPLLPRHGADRRRRRLRDLRGHQPALRRRRAGAPPAGRPALGARLPPHAHGRDAPPARALRTDRVLPAHALPELRGLPRAPRARAPAPRPPRGGRHRLPDRVVPPPLRPGDGAPARRGARAGRGRRGLRGPAGAPRRLPDRRRRRRLRRARRAPRGPRGGAADPGAGAGPADRARRRPARLHQGRAAPPRRHRAAPRPGPGDAAPALRADRRPHPRERRRLRADAPRGARDGGPDQRPPRLRRLHARPLPLPVAPRRSPRRPLRRRGRDAGDAAPRRDEPRRQGVRGEPARRRRRAGAERVHRRRRRALGGADRQPLRHRRRGRRDRAGPRDAPRGAASPHGRAPPPGGRRRRPPLGPLFPRRSRGLRRPEGPGPRRRRRRASTTQKAGPDPPRASPSSSTTTAPSSPWPRSPSWPPRTPT